MSGVQLIIHEVPANVRAAIAADAADRDRSVTDVVGAILAARFRMRWEFSDYGFRGITAPDSTTMTIRRVPPELRERLAKRAERHQSPVGKLIVAYIAEHYGLPIHSTFNQRGQHQQRDSAGRFKPRK